MKTFRVLFMIALMLLFLVPAVLLRPTFADHDLPERTSYCAGEVVTFSHNVFMASEQQVPAQSLIETLDEMIAQEKDPLGVAWLEIDKKIVMAIYAENKTLAQHLNDQALGACVNYNHKALHPAGP